VIVLFKEKSPANIIVLLIFGLLIKLPLFLYPAQPVTTAGDGLLYQLILKNLVGTNPFIASAISFMLLYVQALLINYLVNEYRMTTRPTFLPAMACILITSLWPEWNYFSAAMISNTLLIWMLIKLFRLYNASISPNETVFNIGMLAGISTFIFFPSVAFLLPVVVGIMILRPFRLNEVMLVFLGAVTPYYFYSVYLFLTDQFTKTKIFPGLHLEFPYIENSVWLVVSILLIGIPFLASGYYIQMHLHKMLIQARKNWSILLVYLLVALFVPLLSISGFLKNIVIAVIPFAAFHACAYLYPPRKWLSSLLFFVTVAYVLIQQYGTMLWR
jgi:hypothetical protein